MTASTEHWIGREGGCDCGAVRYRFTAPPLALTACHCTGCQTRSGGPMSLSMFLLEVAVELQSGTLVTRTVEDEQYGRRVSSYCGECHVRLWSVSDKRPGLINLKAGTLDDTSDLRPVAHVWVRSKVDWVVIPEGMLTFETQPTAEQSAPILEAWAKQQAARACD